MTGVPGKIWTPLAPGLVHQGLDHRLAPALDDVIGEGRIGHVDRGIDERPRPASCSQAMVAPDSSTMARTSRGLARQWL